MPKVIDSINDLDDVLYEVTNEGGNKDWDWWVVRTVQEYDVDLGFKNLELVGAFEYSPPISYYVTGAVGRGAQPFCRDLYIASKSPLLEAFRSKVFVVRHP